MSTLNEKEAITKSFGRCLEQGNLLFDRFYHHFMLSDPKISMAFAHTDMDRQKMLLKTTINMAILFSASDKQSVATLSLNRLRESHSKNNFNIPPNLYPLWVSSFLKALEETDREYNTKLKKVWENVLNKTCQYMIDGYSK